MEVEKKRSKGGFLNLFDWNGKSRKKLFTNNLELDEESKKGKENVGQLAKSLLHVIEVDESRGSSSNKGSSEFNCSSSVTSDDGCRARAPGVVARLMGLDSLPTSNVSEACSDCYHDLPSFRASHYDRSGPHLWSEDHPEEYLNVSNKEWLSYNHAVESKVRKVQNRPIERFQTEILPPKSAKSIPITHHKLLSPIKSPGFVPTKSTDYIMEAAAKIIEATPQSTAKSRGPSVVSSVPLRIWDLKDKMEAAHIGYRSPKSNEPVVVSYAKGQNSDRRNSEPKNAPVVKASMNLDKRSSDNTRKKGKSVSPGEQSKVTVQRREGSTSTACSSSRSSMQKKEKCDVKANQFSKGQPNTQKPLQKGTSVARTNTGTYANGTNNALRQNNQKQNYMPNKDSATPKTSVYNQQNKTRSIGGSNGTNRILNKVIAKSETACRKTGSTKNDIGKEHSSSRAKCLTQKKQSLNGDSQPESNANNVLNKKDARSIKCNVAVEGCVNWSADSRKKGMDIVSFMFSSPIRSMPDPQLSGQVMEKTNSFNIDSFGDNNQRRYMKNLAFSSPGCNLIENDALTVLLEQKLKELTCKVKSSNCNVIREGSTNGLASSLQDSVSNFDVLSMNSTEQGQRSEIYQNKDISESLDNSCCTSTNSLDLKIKQKWQFRQSEEMENDRCGSNRNERGRELDCRHYSPVSSLEPSITSVCCSDNENSTADSKQFSLAQDHVEVSWCPTNACQPVESETRLSGLASSIVAEDKGERDSIKTVSFVGVKESCNWELAYVREILSCAELMVHEFALGQTDQVITPNLFNLLESQESETGRNGQELSNLGRKALFDSVCECLNVRSQQLSIGSHKELAKSSTLFRRKSLLAEELYREIVSWKSMGDLMVDELVDKDMSSRYGKWIDFDIEAFEEGVEVENGILTSLVDELLSDFLIL